MLLRAVQQQRRYGALCGYEHETEQNDAARPCQVVCARARMVLADVARVMPRAGTVTRDTAICQMRAASERFMRAPLRARDIYDALQA